MFLSNIKYSNLVFYPANSSENPQDYQLFSRIGAVSSFRPTFNKPMQCERAAAVRTIHSNGNLVPSEKCYQNSMKTDFKLM